ncbi:MAG: branched-chain amino acid ABC transporter substrate-binding protein [Betaproteobacteria bacterium]|nr:branched-chain amino acid ABC transporter substrate-binding protein [Betaproteobacteria bacterium]
MSGTRFKSLLLAAILGTAAAANAADTIKVAHVDPLSGPFALVGESDGRMLQAAIDDINARGGVLNGTKLELLHFDSKSSPQETVLIMKQIIDSGIRFVSLGSGSHIAHAIVETLNKHNSRNPDQAVVLLNIAAQDPPLTNEKCSFWHFRWEAHTDMRVNALTDHIVKLKGTPKVYLINQDYAFGQAISRAAKEMLAAKRPDIKVVGDDLHPLGKVKDFAPYVSKIKASGADTVLTGNWGPDLSLLIKASKEAGLGVVYYTLNAHNAGVPSSIGKAGDGHIRQIITWHANIADNKVEKFANDYKKRFNEDMWLFLPKLQMDMLAKAIDTAQSADPVKVAKALHGMRYAGETGEAWMRAEDHQLIVPQYIATFSRVGGPVKYDAEGTGYGWKTDLRLEGKDGALPTTCKMEVPK